MSMLSTLSGSDMRTLFAGTNGTITRQDVQPLSVPRQARTQAEIDKAATEFEAVFLTQMLEHMVGDTMFSDPLAGPSEGDDVYRSWMLDQYGKLMAQSGGIGLADHVRKELMRLQEVTP